MTRKPKEECPRAMYPLTPEGFLTVADGLIRSVEFLVAGTQDEYAWGIAMLSAHALEISLKAFLLSKGRQEDELKGIGHNLKDAWIRAHSSGLDVRAVPPRWCVLLNSVHDGQHILRYRPAAIGIVLPEKNNLARELRSVFDLVQTAVRTNV